MDKQSIQDEVAEFLKTEQGAALVADSLAALINSRDTVLIQPKKSVVANLQGAIKKVDEARQALHQAEESDPQSTAYSKHKAELLRAWVKLSEVVRLLKSEQDEDLAAESLERGHMEEPDPEVFLTREQILDRATNLTLGQGGDVEFWAGNIQSAINRLNGATPLSWSAGGGAPTDR
ncbi:hypothetical protein [uncultured Microbulbifer sp.]|uniref:hypothetical protein n=1 Tax=uncultured Microbulbifer sp. TaxID=348147 RepID=UPI002609A6BE|nr:hypothetical protein [uncultured Microbulbifer sp.]